MNINYNGKPLANGTNIYLHNSDYYLLVQCDIGEGIEAKFNFINLSTGNRFFMTPRSMEEVRQAPPKPFYGNVSIHHIYNEPMIDTGYEFNGERCFVTKQGGKQFLKIGCVTIDHTTKTILVR